jgi:MFS family permease
MTRRAVVVAALGTTQTLAWASTYYLPAILTDPMAADLQVPRSAIFGVFSAAMLLTAALGPSIGRAIDRYGGRGVLVISNFVFADGLLLLGAAHGPTVLAAAWGVLGVGMRCVSTTPPSRHSLVFMASTPGAQLPGAPTLL